MTFIPKGVASAPTGWSGFPDGTAALPSVYAAGATGTGLSFNSSTNAVRISTNGSQAVLIDSSQRVGIGGTALVPFHVFGNATDAWAARVDNTAAAGSANGLQVSAGTNSSDVALLVRAQNVGALYFQVRGDGLVTLGDASHIALGSTTGNQIGTATTQKLGFYGVTAIAQRAGAAQAAVATTASTQTTPYGYTTAAQADAIVTLVNELRAWAVAQGFIKGSA